MSEQTKVWLKGTLAQWANGVLICLLAFFAREAYQDIKSDIRNSMEAGNRREAAIQVHEVILKYQGEKIDANKKLVDDHIKEIRNDLKYTLQEIRKMNQ